MKRFLRPDAFSLVEITVALGIMSFCLLALFGLLPVGLTSNQTAVEQTKAAGIAFSVFADLKAPLDSNGQSPRYKFKIPSATNPQVVFTEEDGRPTGNPAVKATTTLIAGSRYRVSVGIPNPNPNTDPKASLPVRILVTWPALSEGIANTSGWPTKFSGSFESVVTLDRN